MAEIYLLPENVSASDARMVLDFLNAAHDADEIATAVELPDELDIGLRVGARILARRDELGGFQTLEQVYGVPYVGPERFTELVTSLSNARPPQPFDDQVDRALLTQITQRLNALESASRPAPSLRLWAVNPDALLGQETILLAELLDANGKPMVDQELTLVTTWGRLHGRAGLSEVQGNSVTVRSNHLGLCRVRLEPPIGESLSAVEEASLTQALALLGVAAGSPRDNLQALTEFARRYRAPGGDALRRAVDVLYQQHGSCSRVDAPIDSLASWPRIPVTVVAWLTPPPDRATGQVPNTLLSIQQRNWFFAFLWAYRQLLEADAQLGASLNDVTTTERSGDAILGELFGRVSSFVKVQEGLVGQQVGQQYASAHLNDYLQTRLDNIPMEARTQILTGIVSGANTLSKDVQAFATLKDSQTGLNLKLDSRLAGVGTNAEIAALDARIAQVESSALTQAALPDIQASILAQLSSTTSLQIDQLRQEFNLALEGKADVTRVNAIDVQLANKADATRVDAIDVQLAGKADISHIEAINVQLANIDQQSRALDAGLKQLDTRVTGMDSRIDTLGRNRPR